MEPYNLDNSLGFLLGVAYRKISQLLLQRLKPYDITPEQWSVLFRIRNREGIIQKQIADLAGKDRPTTTRILDALEAKGLVTRHSDPSDRRSFLVFCTAKGKEIADLAMPIEQKTIADAVSGIDEADLARLIDSLRKIEQSSEFHLAHQE